MINTNSHNQLSPGSINTINKDFNDALPGSRSPLTRWQGFPKHHRSTGTTSTKITQC